MAVDKFNSQEPEYNLKPSFSPDDKTNYNKFLIGLSMVIVLGLVFFIVFLYFDRQEEDPEKIAPEEERPELDLDPEAHEDTRDLSGFRGCEQDSDCILISDCVRKVKSVNKVFEEGAIAEMQKYLTTSRECFISPDFFKPKCENNLCVTEESDFHEELIPGPHPETAEETLNKIIEGLEQEDLEEVKKYVVPEASILALNPDGSINQNLISSLQEFELNKERGVDSKSFLTPDFFGVVEYAEVFMYRPANRWIVIHWDAYE